MTHYLFREELEEDFYGNDIYNDHSYVMQYDRLKRGRLENELKNIIHSREPIPTALIDELNKPKPTQNSDTKWLIDKDRKVKNRAKAQSDRKKKVIKEVDSESTDDFNRDNEKSNGVNLEDAIPLLIIDVNIRPGVKKKIYVYDGDTAESLAQKFAKDYSNPTNIDLDSQTGDKLTQLIQSHMSKLLMKIDEENQSISEKSSVNNKQDNRE